jgi:hypothetical protein
MSDLNMGACARCQRPNPDAHKGPHAHPSDWGIFGPRHRPDRLVCPECMTPEEQAGMLEDAMQTAIANVVQPVLIGSVELHTDELLSVCINDGRVECPIWASAEIDPEHEDPFMLILRSDEARNLAGLLMYAAGRVDEELSKAMADRVDRDD